MPLTQRELPDLEEHHKQIWNVMNQRGWYAVRPANPQDVARAQNVLGGPPM
jgi:spore coat protein CotF